MCTFCTLRLSPRQTSGCRQRTFRCISLLRSAMPSSELLSLFINVSFSCSLTSPFLHRSIHPISTTWQPCHANHPIASIGSGQEEPPFIQRSRPLSISSANKLLKQGSPKHPCRLPSHPFPWPFSPPLIKQAPPKLHPQSQRFAMKQTSVL